MKQHSWSGGTEARRGLARAMPSTPYTYPVSMIKPALHDDWKALLKLCLITMAANLPCRYVSHFALETAHDNLS